jgi:hypothetical protein
VLQDPEEQLLQLEEEALMRLEPPPMPKPEMSFLTSADPHSGQTTSLSFPAVTRHSNLLPHVLHEYSYNGISSLFYRIHRTWSIFADTALSARGPEKGTEEVLEGSIKR